MKVLVLGSNGQLGLSLRDHLSGTDHEVVYASREQIDVTDLEEVEEKVTEINPDCLINASAYTAVDEAERHWEEANDANNIAVSNLARVCLNLDCWLIHVSTDYVFDGESQLPYGEFDETAPRSVYGQTKLDGERAIQSSGCSYIIIRTAWVFSEYGNNFLKSMIRLGRDREELNVVADQTECPTYAKDLAKAIVTILPSLIANHSCSGIYHYSGGEACSWHDFAVAIFLEAEKQGLQVPRKVNPISTAEYPTLAVRPRHSVLDCNAIFRSFGVSPSNWRFGIKQVIGELKL